MASTTSAFSTGSAPLPTGGYIGQSDCIAWNAAPIVARLRNKGGLGSGFSPPEVRNPSCFNACWRTLEVTASDPISTPASSPPPEFQHLRLPLHRLPRLFFPQRRSDGQEALTESTGKKGLSRWRTLHGSSRIQYEIQDSLVDEKISPARARSSPCLRNESSGKLRR